jgi:hypothetical protein
MDAVGLYIYLSKDERQKQDGEAKKEGRIHRDATLMCDLGQEGSGNA